MPFSGFGQDAIAFLRELARDNSREFFDANRERYERVVREPAEAFIVAFGAALAAEYPSVRYDTRRNGAGSLMRVYRDVRFSPDKRPFKENVGIIFPLAPGKKVEVPIFYFHIEAGRSFFYGGRHVFPPEALERYRAAAADEKSGKRLVSILADLAAAGLDLMEESAYKRVPRGFPADHPRADLLRMAALGVGMDFSFEEIGRADLADRCLRAAAAMKPLIDWLFAADEALPRP